MLLAHKAERFFVSLFLPSSYNPIFPHRFSCNKSGVEATRTQSGQGVENVLVVNGSSPGRARFVSGLHSIRDLSLLANTIKISF